MELNARSVTIINVLKHDTKMESGTNRVKSEEASTLRKFAARAKHIMPKMITVTYRPSLTELNKVGMVYSGKALGRGYALGKEYRMWFVQIS